MSVLVQGELFEELNLIESFYEILKTIKKASSVTRQAKKRAATFCLEALKTGLVKISNRDCSLLQSIVR